LLYIYFLNQNGMKLINVLLLSCSLFFGHQALAFSLRKADKSTVSSYSTDTIHIKKFVDTALILAYTNSNLATFYAYRALHLSEKVKYENGVGQARYCLGNLELIRGNFDKAVAQFSMSAKIFQELNDSHRAPKSLSALAVVYIRQWKLSEALKNLFLSLNLEEKNKDINGAAGCLLNIGVVFFKMGDFEKAKYYFRQSLEIYIKLKDSQRINVAITNLGSVFGEQGKTDSALYYYQKTLDYFEKSKTNKFAQVHILVEMSVMYQKKSEYTKSFEVLEKALSICKTMEMRENYAKTITEMAKTYYATGQDDKALEFAKKALEITRNDNLLSTRGDICNVLYNINKKRGKTDLALQTLEELKVVRDSLQKANNVEEMEKMDSKYLTEKLQQKELILQQQSDLYETRRIQFYLILSIIILSLGFLSIMFFVKQQAARRKTKILEQETEINKQKVIIHQQETALYEAELNKQKNEILAISTLQGKTNEALLQIINEIRQLAFQELKNKPVSDTLYKMAGNIEKLSTTDSWSDFRKWFTDIHPHFYENLNKICPSLTSNDLKLASLLRMNLSSKEIASLTLRSLDSIHIAKHRLRKKLGLEDDNKLISFLLSVPS
jgi:tetratricopeptide (TPR) repeat protein